MEAVDTIQQGRPQLMRRRSSMEIKVSQDNVPTNRRKVIATVRSSTLAFVASLFVTYAWFLSIAVGSSFLTFSLIDSAHDSLQSLKRDQQVFQGFLDQLKLETQVARKDLEISRSTCRLDPIQSPFDSSLVCNNDGS